MLLFATGFKRPRAEKKDTAAALFVADHREECSDKNFGTPLAGVRMAGARAADLWAAGLWAHGRRANGLKGLCVGSFFARRKEFFAALKQAREVIRAHGAGIEKSLCLNGAQPGQKLPLRSVFNAFAQHPHI